MIIRVVKRQHPYVQIDKTALEDERLSFRAKGLHAYLLSRPDNWNPNPQHLAKVSREGRDAVIAALKELKRAGYYERKRIRRDNGTFEWVGYVYEVSVAVSSTNGNPGTGYPVTGFPVPDDPVTGESALIKNEVTITEVTIQEEGVSPTQEVLDRLNELREANWTWKKYTPLTGRGKTSVEHINGRLDDGFSVEQLCLVLEWLAAKDGGKDRSRQYFDSVTPFRVKNFERNLAMANDWDANGRPSLREPGPGAMQRSDGDGGWEKYERLERGMA